MKKNTSKTTAALLTFFLSLLICGGMAMVGAKKKGANNKGQIDLEQIERGDDGSIRIVFRPMAESVWYCPGVETKEHPKGTEVVFVRQSIWDKSKVSHPAKPFEGGKEGLKVVTIPSKGEAIHLKKARGQKVVEILPRAGE